MCGIAGKIDFEGWIDPDLIHRMCAAIEHRGPDSRGVWSVEGASLGMQRLAIIDVAGGDQPIFNEDRSVAVVMNGEIYNFQELRRELVGKGHEFKTRSDTEVLVHLYEECGERLVERLRGMFAFAIWDVRRRRLLLARDRVGKKPLYVARRGSKVWFASELMALLQDPDIDRTPNPAAIAAYLAYKYVPHPMSAFEGVEKLPPASTMLISSDQTRTRRYWDLDFETKEDRADPKELAGRLRSLIWEATRVRLLSEVPLGAFLSGGIDSSAVVAAMADQTSEPVRTFSIGFSDAAFDELRFARMVAQRYATDHHEFVVEPDALEIMPKLVRHFGEPFADASAIPSFYLAEMTSRHVTVALNGDGGDESFAGYQRYIQNQRAARIDALPSVLRELASRLAGSLNEDTNGNDIRSRIRRLSPLLNMDAAGRYTHWMSAFPQAVRAEILQPEFLASTGDWCPEDVVRGAWDASRASSGVDRMLDTDVNTYLPGDLLAKMDIATMAHSVEGRSPFLDHQLMEFAAALPPALKLRGRSSKRLLKLALRGVVPDEILDRSKMGFGVPLCRWFRDDLRELPRELLMGADSRVHAYVRPDAIARLIAGHHSGAFDHSARLWVLLQLELWHREVVEAPLCAAEPTEALPAR